MSSHFTHLEKASTQVKPGAGTVCSTALLEQDLSYRFVTLKRCILYPFKALPVSGIPLFVMHEQNVQITTLLLVGSELQQQMRYFANEEHTYIRDPLPCVH